MSEIKVGSTVMRKSGKPTKGWVEQQVSPEKVAVKWDAPRRRNSYSTHTSVIRLSQLIPFSEGEQKARLAKTRVKHLERQMRLHYELFGLATDPYLRISHAINLATVEIKYSKIVYGGERHEMGICSCCGKERIIQFESGYCGTCWHRKARKINTREMYGRGRRGY